MENMSTDAHKTAHTMQSASKKLRHIFTDEQLHALEAEWNAGLTSVKDGRRIENLANSLNLMVQQIRDWIGNKRQRQKDSIQQPAVSSSASKPVPMQLKGPSGYKYVLQGKIAWTNKVATSTSLDENCRLAQDQVEIPNEIQGSMEDDENQTAFLPNIDHNEVPKIMQELLKDELKRSF